MANGSRTPPDTGDDHVAVIALPADLVFAARIRAAAEAAGVRAEICRNPADLEAAATRAPGALVLLDLDARRADVPELIRRLRAAGGEHRILAFGSHVGAERLAAARDAGADRVMARSGFVRELPLLLVLPDR